MGQHSQPQGLEAWVPSADPGAPLLMAAPLLHGQRTEPGPQHPKLPVGPEDAVHPPHMLCSPSY